MLAIPPTILEILNLRPGNRVGLTVRNGRLVVETQPRPRYALDKLLVQCKTKASRTEEEREWLNGKPVGRELI